MQETQRLFLRPLQGEKYVNRQELTCLLETAYGACGEFPWPTSPSYQVFRHGRNKKWFAVIMDIPGEKLGLSGAGEVSVVNLKCDTRLIGSFRELPGIFPGWHMNKAHWITVILNGTVPEETLRFLVDMSYELTKK